MKNNKHGGFSCFIAIIMTSIIVLMTVLMRASSIRSDEAILTGSLIQQQDLILSQYCEKLLDWYGIYATTIPDECADAFLKASDSIKPLSAYSCKGMAPLDSGEDFREAVLDFARPRVPIQLTMQLVGRFTQINEIIQSQTIDFKGVDNESESTPSDDGSDPSKDTALDFSSIMDFLELIDKDSFEKNLTEETKESFTWDNLEELLKSDPENPAFEMDVSKEMKSQLSVTESNLNDLSFLLNQFYQIDSNEVYDKLCFEFYITSMFSCKTNMMIQNDIEINRKDLRNRSISTLPTHDPLEIEQIIFGYEDQGKNDFYTKISIESIRFLIHLLSNFTDKSQKAENAGIAASLCTVIAIASAGTVVIPEEIMEIVVIILKSMSSAAKDYTALSEGKGVPLLPIENYKIMDTFYMDYLQVFLLVVPEEVKMKRMIGIIRNNLFLSAVPLYTGISVSVNYRGIVYGVEGRYDGYDSKKE